jgi:NAD(P)-dependent dehydrogenase (short-subunit alcohol dehydrogenase family)
MYNPFTLNRKTIFITGASSGIGRAIAIECSKMGANLIISGRNAERLQETFDMLEGAAHSQIIADLTQNQDIMNFVDKIHSLDGLVHCAGYTRLIPFQFIKEDDILSVMKVNFISPAIISQTLIRNKKLNKGASIVFISSISGVYCSSVAESIYSASKGAVNGIVKAMAIELAVKGIRVNSVNPGVVETSFFSEGLISSEQLLDGIKNYPLKRYGKPEDIAYAVIYLLSDAAQWVTGSNLLIDGGYTLL